MASCFPHGTLARWFATDRAVPACPAMPPTLAAVHPDASERASTASDRHGRTTRLELADQTLRTWEATVLASDRRQGIALDRSAC